MGKKYNIGIVTKLLFYILQAKGKGQEVFEEASKHLGLLDTELFGLAFFQGKIYSGLSKYFNFYYKNLKNLIRYFLQVISQV